MTDHIGSYLQNARPFFFSVSALVWYKYTSSWLALPLCAAIVDGRCRRKLSNKRKNVAVVVTGVALRAAMMVVVVVTVTVRRP